MLRKVGYIIFPFVAALGPIAYFTAQEPWQAMTTALSSIGSKEEPSDQPEGEKGPSGGSLYAIEGATVHDLTEVLRFDVSADWIASRWPRVTTGLAELRLQGYRVPLVTGTGQHDLAGALTYYFDPGQQVQRITFHGKTGDYRWLVDTLTTYYGFVPRRANAAGLYVYEVPTSKGPATSALWIRPASVVDASQPASRFDITLLIERPGRNAAG